MFKSCNYCRHRKKKCTLDGPWASRCAECEHLDLVCEFSRRQPSQKRRQTSQRIASRVSAAAAVSEPRATRERQWASTGSVVSVVKDGDSQLKSADAKYPTGQKIILKDETQLVLDSIATKYREYVQPLTPFVPSEMIHEAKENWDPTLQQCVELAASIWLHSNPHTDISEQASHSLKSITQSEMSLPRLAGVLLIILRYPIESDCIQWVSSCSSHCVSIFLTSID